MFVRLAIPSKYVSVDQLPTASRLSAASRPGAVARGFAVGPPCCVPRGRDQPTDSYICSLSTDIQVADVPYPSSSCPCLETKRDGERLVAPFRVHRRGRRERAWAGAATRRKQVQESIGPPSKAKEEEKRHDAKSTSTLHRKKETSITSSFDRFSFPNLHHKSPVTP